MKSYKTTITTYGITETGEYGITGSITDSFTDEETSFLLDYYTKNKVEYHLEVEQN
jgi:hypothetical protein